MQSQPAYNHNQFSGAIANGAESMISTFSLGSTLASGVSSAQALQSQKSEAFQSTLGRGFSDGVSQIKPIQDSPRRAQRFVAKHSSKPIDQPASQELHG